MAWIRTATSLITFGFAIFSFFVIPSGAGHGLTVRQRGASIYAVMLICFGLFALVSAAIQRERARKEMQAESGVTPPRSPSGLIGALLAGMGVIALGIVVYDTIVTQ